MSHSTYTINRRFSFIASNKHYPNGIGDDLDFCTIEKDNLDKNFFVIEIANYPKLLCIKNDFLLFADIKITDYYKGNKLSFKCFKWSHQPMLTMSTFIIFDDKPTKNAVKFPSYINYLRRLSKEFNKNVKTKVHKVKIRF